MTHEHQWSPFGESLLHWVDGGWTVVPNPIQYYKDGGKRGAWAKRYVCMECEITKDIIYNESVKVED